MTSTLFGGPVRAILILAPSRSDSSRLGFSLPRATRRAAAAPARRTPTCVQRQQGPRGTPCGERHVARSTWHGACLYPALGLAKYVLLRKIAWRAPACSHRGRWEAGGGEAPGDRLADHGLGSQVDCFQTENGLRSKISKHKTMKSCTALSLERAGGSPRSHNDTHTATRHTTCAGVQTTASYVYE